MFDRGYTGHEHLDIFGLLNIIGRMYDPKLGRMLSPDILVQDGGNTQCYNRYSYCVNNPLAYTDPSGYVYEHRDMHPLNWNDGQGMTFMPGPSLLDNYTTSGTYIGFGSNGSSCGFGNLSNISNTGRNVTFRGTTVNGYYKPIYTQRTELFGKETLWFQGDKQTESTWEYSTETSIIKSYQFIPFGGGGDPWKKLSDHAKNGNTTLTNEQYFNSVMNIVHEYLKENLPQAYSIDREQRETLNAFSGVFSMASIAAIEIPPLSFVLSGASTTCSFVVLGDDIQVYARLDNPTTSDNLNILYQTISGGAGAFYVKWSLAAFGITTFNEVTKKPK